jgi:endoglucanase
MATSRGLSTRWAKLRVALGALAAAALLGGPAATAAVAHQPRRAKQSRTRHRQQLAHQAAATASPLAGLKWYVNPSSPAAAQVTAWTGSEPAQAAEVEKIATEPVAQWFGNWNSNVQTAVAATVNAAAALQEVPQLVAYDIPERDCGGYSSGGATSAAAYESWVRQFATGIGPHRAVVILEPDALAGISCLSATDQASRISLLNYAVSVLRAHAGVYLYLDAGNSGWQSASTMATRLQQAGVSRATGFALNVSNFYTTSQEESYGASISALVGAKHFVIDTSRNGNGSSGQWCNPAGRALGTPPTAATGDTLVDAFLWIKYPGESDGTCNGGPSAGTWWPSYALGLAENASF